MDLKFRYLFSVAVLLLGLCVPVVNMQAAVQKDRTLHFYNTHTHENMSVTYVRNGRYVQAAADDINSYLRDHRNGHVHEISRDLMNLLHVMQQELQRRHPEQDIVFHVISGYRSPQTNAMLRAAGGGQAKKSRHMQGDAIDIRVPGIKSSEIRNMAWCMQRGGVGYYRGSNFVHVDTHSVRHWNWQPKADMCGRSNS